jgi:omega-hydroxy-beta-dihydromenaquinone-9 sulfotransferase
MTSLGTMPFRAMFDLKYKRAIRKSSLAHPPIFIIGHWRSGTTYLQELLNHDPQFCSISLWHTMVPSCFPILEPFKKGLSTYLPTTRPMDNMDVTADGVYEEEAGMAVLYPYSFFHCFHFPRNAEKQYASAVHFEGLSKKEVEDWKKRYVFFLKTVSYMNPEKTLLLKNPANTARIETILDLFPDARFIHIYRNPYKVFLSTMKMRTQVLDVLALQKSNKEDIEHHVINDYIRLMKSFFEKKDLIPKDQFYEIKYESFIKDPLKQVESMYDHLGIPGFQIAKKQMEAYLETKKNYKVNVYKIDKDLMEKIRKHWGFTIKKWEYSVPK